MSDRKKVLPDNIPNIGFNLEAQEQFVKDHGVVFTHWSAIPSPIGLKDRGDYRRPDSLDTVSSNGFIYKKVGEFTGTIMGNSKGHEFGDGIIDNSTARLVLPKYYNNCEKEIALLPGDRIYAKDIEISVPNYQRVDFNPKSVDYLQFPAKEVEHLIDSKGLEYKQGVDFKIDKDGNIKWIKGKKNPGIDIETGNGSIYSIRYTYNAFWYIQHLINEIRITNEGDNSQPQRMPYHVTIQREYVYHNRVKGDSKESNIKIEDSRTNEEPTENIDPNGYQVKVDMRDFE